MSEDPRDEVILNAVTSFNGAARSPADVDLASLMDFIHPEVRARVAEGLGNPGSYEGREGFGAMMADWSEAWSEQEVRVREIEHVDEAVSLVHTDQALIGAGSGVPIKAETTFLVVFEGEQAIRFEIHPNRASALEAL